MVHSHRIQFEKPNLVELTRRYTVVDLHFHTHYSDGVNSVDTIAERARKLGIGIAITDHNEIRGALEIDKYKNILSIPGIEITSKEGTHLLVYFYSIQGLKRFYEQHIEPFMGPDVMSSTALEMEEIIDRARIYKTLIIFPHPYSAVYTGIINMHFPGDRLNRMLQMIDGVEAINSENLKRWNLQGAVLGFNLQKAITGGSDGHQLSQLGKVVSYAPCKKSRKAFLDAIRNQQNQVIGKETPILRKVTSNGIKLRSSLKHYPDLVGKNIRYSYTVFNSKSKTIRENMKRTINTRIRKI